MVPKSKIFLGDMTCVAQGKILLGGHDLWCPRVKFAYMTSGTQEGILLRGHDLWCPSVKIGLGDMTCGAQDEILLRGQELFQQ